MIWLIGLGIIVSLAFVPLNLRGEYDGSGARAWLQVGSWKYPLYPRKKSAPKQRRKPIASKHVNESPAKGSSKEFKSIVSILFDVVKDLHRKLHVDMLELKIALGDSDPADLAIKYGRVCGLIGTFLPQLEQVLVIKQRDVDVSCDFFASKTVITSKLYLSLTLGRIIGLLVNHGMKFAKNRFITTSQRKGGAKV